MASFDLIPSLPPDLALDCLHRVPLQSHSTLSQVCSSWKSLVSSPSYYQSRHFKGFTDYLACIIQATHKPSSPGKSPIYGISLYDEKRKSWDDLPPIHDLPNGLPLFCSCVAVGSHLVLLGGWDPSSWTVLTSVYVYDFSHSQWRSGSRMPTARSFFACASAGGLGKIIVAGGHDESKNAMRSAEMYDVGKDEWESLPDMGEERDECKAAMFNGKLMVVSGFSTESQGQFLRSAEIFHLEDRRWETVDKFWPAGGRSSPSSIVAFKDQMYALLDGKLVRLKKSGSDNAWETVVDLPPAIKVPACVTPLRDGILVVGFSGTAQMYNAFVCCVGTAASASSPAMWQKVNGDVCCGIVQQTACTIEL